MENILEQISKVKRDKLGSEIPIVIFRALRHFTSIYAEDILGEKGANIIFQNAGKSLGKELGKILYDPDLDKFLSNVSKYVEDEKIGVINISEFTDEKIVIQLDECITCAGMESIGKRICFFEVGLVQGIIEHYLDKKLTAFESKCNANGEEVCEVTVLLNQ
ncbi:V4R domain-containing protein [Persephonella sp.]